MPYKVSRFCLNLENKSMDFLGKLLSIWLLPPTFCKLALVISSASLRMSQDMGQILVPILFSVLCQKVGTPHPAAVPLLVAVGVR